MRLLHSQMSEVAKVSNVSTIDLLLPLPGSAQCNGIKIIIISKE